MGPFENLFEKFGGFGGFGILLAFYSLFLLKIKQNGLWDTTKSKALIPD